jgi:hypothetical protein
MGNVLQGTIAGYNGMAKLDRIRTFWNGQPGPEAVVGEDDMGLRRVIADGKVANRRASIGLFLDHDIAPGEYDIANDPRIRIVYNQSPHSSSNVIYHSAHFQTGSLILTEADLDRHKLAGQFSFSVSAVDFEVTEGAFDLYCSLSAST